jgi:hypothetical protein
MRKLLILFSLASVAGCGTIRKTFGLKDSSPAHREPSSTSIWGDWVLRTPVDSTAFVGARVVQLSLNPTGFVITANYPSQGPMTITGSTSVADGTLLTLTPATGGGMEGRTLAFAPGQPISLRASAAGGTLVFAPPSDVNLLFPSSVWNKKENAQAAGLIVGPDTTKRQP